MPVATPQHKEAGTVSRYLLPKPPRHSPSLLSSPRPGSHHGFSADPQACLQVSRPLSGLADTPPRPPTAALASEARAPWHPGASDP